MRNTVRQYFPMCIQRGNVTTVMSSAMNQDAVISLQLDDLLLENICNNHVFLKNMGLNSIVLKQQCGEDLP